MKMQGGTSRCINIPGFFILSLFFDFKFTFYKKRWKSIRLKLEKIFGKKCEYRKLRKSLELERKIHMYKFYFE